MVRIALAAFALSLSLAAATPEEELKQAETRWATAVKSRDVAALEKMLSPRLIYNHSSGVVEDKAKYMERLKSGKQRYDGVEHKDMNIQVYGNAAVVSSHAHMFGQSDVRKFDDQLIVIHFWVKQNGQWILAAHQTTKLP